MFAFQAVDPGLILGHIISKAFEMEFTAFLLDALHKGGCKDQVGKFSCSFTERRHLKETSLFFFEHSLQFDSIAERLLRCILVKENLEIVISNRN